METTHQLWNVRSLFVVAALVVGINFAQNAQRRVTALEEKVLALEEAKFVYVPNEYVGVVGGSTRAGRYINQVLAPGITRLDRLDAFSRLELVPRESYEVVNLIHLLEPTASNFLHYLVIL